MADIDNKKSIAQQKKAVAEELSYMYIKRINNTPPYFALGNTRAIHLQ